MYCLTCFLLLLWQIAGMNGGTYTLHSISLNTDHEAWLLCWWDSHQNIISIIADLHGNEHQPAEHVEVTQQTTQRFLMCVNVKYVSSKINIIMNKFHFYFHIICGRNFSSWFWLFHISRYQIGCWCYDLYILHNLYTFPTKTYTLIPWHWFKNTQIHTDIKFQNAFPFSKNEFERDVIRNSLVLIQYNKFDFIIIWMM